MSVIMPGVVLTVMRHQFSSRWHSINVSYRICQVSVTLKHVCDHG